MFRISPNEVRNVSIIIAICDTEHAAIAGDKRNIIRYEDTVQRLIDGKSSVRFISDDTTKVFRVNNNVLFGTGGLFYKIEPLDLPFRGKDMSSATVDDCVKYIVDFLEYVSDDFFPIMKRHYLLTGKDANGKMCIKTVSYEQAGHKIDVQELYPEENCYTHIFALPPLTDEDAECISEHFANLVQSGDNWDSVFSAIKSTIKKTSAINNTVSETCDVLFI